MNDKVMKPWTPVRVREDGETIYVGTWGRENKSGKSSFLESMRSQGKELLAAPVRVVGTEDGREFIFSDYDLFSMNDRDESFAETLASAESDEFVINLSMKSEFDGFIDTSLTVAPKGRSVKQIFGLEKLKEQQFVLERLWIEIPLNKEVAKYYQMFPRTQNTGALEAVGAIEENITLPFKSQIFLADESIGLMLSFESPKNVTPIENDRFIEIIPNENEVLLRIRLIDEEPYAWRHLDKNDPKERTYLEPLSFRFGILTTPVKPLENNLVREKAVHIDCFKKIPESYEQFLGGEYENTGEITLDRMKRLGVNTLYLHEKWNDLQNSPFLTTKTDKRLCYIIDECHKRNIKVIPYFGYEISTLSPYFSEMIRDVEVTSDKIGRWYRQPSQRDAKACQRSRWSEFFTEGIERLIDKYNFDGVYLDGTAYLWACTNTRHGCGYEAPDGKIFPTFPVFATRKTMKQIYKTVREDRGGIINCHAGSAFNMPALSFATSLWEGETFQSEFIKGNVTKLPDEYFKCLYTGRNLGLPIYLLCYLNPPVWTFDMALAVALPYGIIPKVNDVGEPLEKISEIWKVYDSFGIENAEFVPFYSGMDKGIKVSDDRVKVSVYKKDDKLLAILALTDNSLELEFSANASRELIKHALTGEVLSDKGEVTLRLSGFDFTVLEIE